MKIVFKNKVLPILIFSYCFMLSFGIYIFISDEIRVDAALLTQVALNIAGVVFIALSLSVLSSLQISISIDDEKIIFNKCKFFLFKSIVIKKSEIEKIETPFEPLRKGYLIIYLKNKEKIKINFSLMSLSKGEMENVKLRQYAMPSEGFIGAASAARYISKKYGVPYSSIHIRNDDF